MQLTPIRIDGRHVALDPLREEHVSALWAASTETEIGRWMPFALRDEDDLRRFAAGARAQNEAGSALAFVILRHPDGEPAGMTGFWNADPAHRRVEIGATWVAKTHQRTPVNTECKYLLLRHAFDTLGCLRVEFKTDARNRRSRRALRRIGACEEGTLRSHMVLSDGSTRDSVYFSIIAPEWPTVRDHLQALLVRGQGPGGAPR